MGGNSSKRQQVTQQERIRQQAAKERANRNKTKLRIVMIGDGAVGKTSAAVTIQSGAFPKDYRTTEICENFVVSRVLDGDVTFNRDITFVDVPGQEDYDRLRRLWYAETDLFLVLFSIVRPSSLENVNALWLPEINHLCPGIPHILVGTKADLREDEETLKKLQERKRNPVTTREGEWKAEENQAADYLEISSLTNENMDLLFEKAVTIALMDSPPLYLAPSRGLAVKRAK